MAATFDMMGRRAFFGQAGAFVAWHPLALRGRVRVVQWGMLHDHAIGKFKALKQLAGDFELAGIVDDRASTSRHERHDCSIFEGERIMSPEDVWADDSIKGVLVETPNEDLLDVAWQCARHGLAIHLEKPGGDDHARFAALMEFCRARGIPVQMGYMFRTNPAIAFAARAVREGWLGKMISVEADMNHDYGGPGYGDYIASFKGGLMYNLGCHLVDFILPMMPGMPLRAHVVSLPSPEDTGNPGTNCISVLEWKTSTVTLRAARNAACSRRRLRIQGTKGALELCPMERFDGRPLMVELRLKESVGAYGKGEHLVDCGVQTGRFTGQLLEFARIVKGESRNPPEQYRHDTNVHKVTLMACGMNLDTKATGGTK